MSLISGTIPNLISGVSQQPDALRQPSQCEYMNNAFPSVVEGLIKRPPTNHIAKIWDGVLGDAFLHTINRDEIERYQVVIRNGDLKVFDIEGNEYTVAFPNGRTYLSTDKPSRMITALTIADYTFVLNKDAEVAMMGDLTPTRPTEAVIFINQAAYRTTYEIKLDGYTATYTTATGETDPDKTDQENEDARQLDSTGISEGLKQVILNAELGYEVDVYKSTMWVRKTDGSEFACSGEDTRSNTCITVFQNQIQRFSQLPAAAPDGYVVEITGEASSSFNNYHVKFKADPGFTTINNGVWEETIKPGLKFKLNAATMPHGLVRETSGDFTFRELEWGDRVVGDEDSAPEPAFVGNKINDIFFFRNRLGFLTGANATMSRTTEFFEFFPTTITTLLATDPVDTAAGHTKVSILNYAIPFQEKLLCFSGQTQFQLDGDVSPKSADLIPISEFESAIDVKPVAAGKNLFFALPRGRFTNIKEYYTDEDTRTRDAIDITAHVPQYLPSGVFKLIESSNEDILLVLSREERNHIYFYKYYWGGNEKMQSAWGKWDFGDHAQVLSVAFIESRLYLVMQYPDGVYLEYMNIEPAARDTHAPFVYHIDRKVKEVGLTPTYYSAENETVYTLPFPIHGEPVVISRHVPVGEQDKPFGKIALIKRYTDTQVVVKGDWANTSVFIGNNYEMRYRFSHPVLKHQSAEGGMVASIDGRLQIRNFSILYADTGWFSAEVKVSFRDTSEYTFTSRVLGEGSLVVGDLTIASGKFRIPILSQNDRFSLDIINNTYLPCKFIGAGWEGLYTTRNRRV